MRRLKFIRKRLEELRENEKLKLEEENPKTNGTSAGHSQNGANPGWVDLEADVTRVGEVDDSFTNHRNASTEDALEDVIRAAALDVKQESNMEMFLDDDEIEQMAVYYREYARRFVGTR